jgi:hypothetical protein
VFSPEKLQLEKNRLRLNVNVSADSSLSSRFALKQLKKGEKKTLRVAGGVSVGIVGATHKKPAEFSAN